MRPIDADELMEHIGRDRLDSREAIMRMVENAPPIQFEQWWIPVSEKLPDKSAVYTVTDYYGRVTRLAFHNNERNYKFWHKYIKAWIPKPKPYQKG